MNWRRGLEMYWQHKVSWSATLIGYAVVRDMKTEGFTLGDAMYYAGTGIAVTAVWIPEIRAMILGAALATPAIPAIVTGTTVAYAAGGILAFATADPKDEGFYGAQALKEYAVDPVGTTYETISTAVKETATRVEALATGVGRAVAREVERRVEEKKQQAEAGWEWVEENWRWFNPTPGLPF